MYKKFLQTSPVFALIGLSLFSPSASAMEFFKNAADEWRYPGTRQALVESKVFQDSIESEKSVQARRAETLAIREPMIDECINQYKILTRKELTYRELADAFLKLSPLYNARQNTNKEKNKEDVGCDLILEKNWFIQPAGLKWGREMTSPNLFITDPRDDGATVPHLNLCLKQIKEDLLENMRLYKDLHGEPHPRFDEFSDLALTSNEM